MLRIANYKLSIIQSIDIFIGYLKYNNWYAKTLIKTYKQFEFPIHYHYITLS